MEKLDLKSLIKQYPNCMESRAKLRSTLMDCYPQTEHKLEINLALIVYESGLLEKIRGKGSLAPHETAAMCAKIENEYGIPPMLSVRAIIAWGEVWGTAVSAAITQMPKAAPSVAVAAEPVPKPVAPVQGSVNEYMIEEREEGWFITKFQGFEQENMTIPNIIDGKLIVGLEGEIFQGCKGIKMMTISEGIRFLRAGVFRDCSLEQVQLPDTLEEIGVSCFEKSGLKSIDIPYGVTRIGADAFHFCKLASVKIPDTVVDIGKGAFGFCSQLSSIVLPKHLKKISPSMFYFCGNLSSVVIPDGCQTIESEAFSDCRLLKEIRIPPSVTSIESDAFGLFGLFGVETIYCAPGSAAMKYARKNGIKCLPL